MKTLRQRKIEFILGEFLAIPTGRDPSTNWYRSPSIETALGGDDACSRAADFEEEFPARTKDPTHEKANARIRRLLNQMEECGAVDKHIIGIYKESIGEGGTWCHVYRLNDVLYNNIKHNIKTVEETAKEILDRI